MTSLAAPDSSPDPVGAPDDEEVQLSDAGRGENESFVLVDDPFVIVSINVEYIADIVWNNDQLPSGNYNRQVYARFSIDPGNVHASTDVFLYSERSPKPVEMVLPWSLATESGGLTMGIEVWEVRRGGIQQEFVGQCTSALQLLRDSKHTIRLSRRRNKTKCGKMGLLVTLNTDAAATVARLSSEIQSSSLLVDKTGEEKNAQLVVMALECHGLPQDFCPVIECNMNGNTEPPLFTDTANHDDNRDAFFWNHRFCFQLPRAHLMDTEVSFTLIHDEEDVNGNTKEMLGSASMKCTEFKLDGSAFCGWLSFLSTKHELSIRVRVACCLLIEDTQREYVQSAAVTPEILEPHKISSDSSAMDKTSGVLLGSLLEVKIEFVCVTSSSEMENLNACFGADGDSQLTVRGRIQLLAGNSQRTTTNALVCRAIPHCDNQKCIRLQTDKAEPILLRFELSPDVVTNLLPQLCLDLRPRKSQNRCLSLLIALPFLLSQLSSKVEYQTSLPLFDQEGRACGRLSTFFRGGVSVDPQSSYLPRTTLVHTPHSRILSVKMPNLQTSNEKEAGSRCVAKIWSSTIHKTQAQTVSLTCGNGGDVSGTNAVSLKVYDANTEMLFVGIYRFSAHERNELIGLGSFSICLPRLSGGDVYSDNQLVEQTVRLYSDSDNTTNEWGLAVLALQLASVPDESESESNSSLAATELASVAYPIRRGEMKCRFDIDIREVQGLPPNLSDGKNSISIQLRVAQSNWKAELGPAKLTMEGSAKNALASVNDKAHAIICWSAKDRSFPVLEVLVYAQPQQPLNRPGTGSKISLASKSLLKQPQGRSGSKATHRTKEIVVPILVATGSLNLCSFFSQLNISARVQMELVPEKADTSAANSESSVSVLSTIRASSCQDSDDNRPLIGPEPTNLMQQAVSGDLCIHLLQATGNGLKKANSLSSYYVLLSSGPEEVISECCLSVEGILTWNQHLVLRIASSGPPTIHVTLYHRSNEPGLLEQGGSNAAQRSRGDQVAGYLTLPLFPSVLEEDHLLQLEIPFGMPFRSGEVDVAKRSSDPYYYKRGMLTLEMQFLASKQPKAKPSLGADIYELVIHRVRGCLIDSITSVRPLGIAKHVFVDISLMSDQGGSAEDVAVGSTRVITISASGMTEVGEVLDLSNPIVALKLLNGSNNVIVGRIRDLSGNYYGRVHLPLRKDWKQRLVNRKKLIWYPICRDAEAGITATKDALLMSLQVREQTGNTTVQAKLAGRYHVSVCEAILTAGFQSSNLLKSAKFGGTNVQLTYSPNSGTRYRTRQSTAQSDTQHWHWENEWFAFSQTDEQNDKQELLVSMQIGAQSNQPRLDGSIDLCSLTKEANNRRVELWIPLGDNLNSGLSTASAHLHIVVVYIPSITGTMMLEFGENFTCSESNRTLRVDANFYKCTVQDTSYTTTKEGREVEENNADSYKRLRFSYDSSLDTSAEVPEFVIHWIGSTKTLGEVCLGVASIDLLLIFELCRLTSEVYVSGSDRETRSVWCSFYDKADRTKITGVVKVRVAFDPTRKAVSDQATDTMRTIESRVASAETFTIWKKLFYLLDENGNGYIDRNEFTDVFLNHVKDMVKTSDGRKLLQLLFGGNGSQDTSTPDNVGAPTQEQIAALFSAMDTNRDNEIEWREYLRFLQQKQQHLFTTVKEIEEDPACDDIEVPLPQVEQNQELRRKHREDRHATQPTIDGHTRAASYQSEVSSEEMRTADPKDLVLKPRPIAPKRSSAGHKLLKLQYSNQEQRRLQEQITALESILAIERRRYAELAADRQALMRAYQQLHLKHQNELVQEQTKSKWMKQTIERQQQQLEEREVVRKNRTEASIVLQSTVRSRLEQKRYQGMKLQRTNAATMVQCLVRRIKAKGVLQALQKVDRENKRRIRAISRMQRFIRFHLHRKERALLVEARNLSATILQKNTRRMAASKVWQRQKKSILKLQCWLRQYLAIHHATKIRDAAIRLKTRVRGWFARRQYTKMKRSTRKIQRWWRRSSKERSAYLELLEAVLCIQSAWKRRSARKWFQREWQRQETYLSQLEAAICIQAAWRGQHQRVLRSRESTPQFEDDSVVEALLYDIVAIIEAGAVSSESNQQIPTDTTMLEAHLQITSSNGNCTDSKEDASWFRDQLSVSDASSESNSESEIFALLANLVDVVVSTSQHGETHEESIGPPVANTASMFDAANPTNSPVVQSELQNVQRDPISSVDLTQDEEVTATIFTENDAGDQALTQATRGELDNQNDIDFTIVEDVLKYITDLVASEVDVGDDNEVHRILSRPNKSVGHDPSSHGEYPHSENLDSKEVPQAIVDAGLDIVTTTDASDPVHTSDSNQIDSLTDSGDIVEPTAELDKFAISEDNIAPSNMQEGEKDIDSGNPSDGIAYYTAELRSDDPTVDSRQERDAVNTGEYLDTSLQPNHEHISDVDASESVGERNTSSTDDGHNMNANETQMETMVTQDMPPDPVASDPGQNAIGPIASKDQPAEVFDADAAAGDFTMPNDSNSDDDLESRNNGESDDESQRGSSIDSTDLMMEADAMAFMQHTAEGDSAPVEAQTMRHRKTERLDSIMLLADFDKLDEHKTSENHPPSDSTDDAHDNINTNE